jgi:choline dehydrogenase-like flavoprotein
MTFCDLKGQRDAYFATFTCPFKTLLLLLFIYLLLLQIKVKKGMEQVGLNLQDKPATFFGPVTVVHDKSFLPRRNLTYSTILEYYVNQSGLLGWNMMSGVGYYSTPSAKDPTHPNIQLTLLPMGIDRDTHKIVSTAYDLKHGYMEEFLRDHKDNDAVWASVTLARPASRGQVRLKNNDPHSHPSIDPNYFKEKEDIVNIVEGK